MSVECGPAIYWPRVLSRQQDFGLAGLTVIAVVVGVAAVVEAAVV